jgi:hypothetical protein
MQSVSEFAVAEKAFFFEKKKQKTFAPSGARPNVKWATHMMSKSFLVPFFKKEPPPSAAA